MQRCLSWLVGISHSVFLRMHRTAPGRTQLWYIGQDSNVNHFVLLFANVPEFGRVNSLASSGCHPEVKAWAKSAFVPHGADPDEQPHLGGPGPEGGGRDIDLRGGPFQPIDDREAGPPGSSEVKDSSTTRHQGAPMPFFGSSSGGLGSGRPSDPASDQDLSDDAFPGRSRLASRYPADRRAGHNIEDTVTSKPSATTSEVVLSPCSDR